MGRGKLSLNLIRNRKCRMSTFRKRKSNLMKKAFELSTLCDVGVCVLIHGPSSDEVEDSEMKKKKKNDEFESEFDTWPPNRSDVQALLRACTNNPNFHKRKCFDLTDFFEDRRAKLLADTAKLRQNNTHHPQFPNPNPNPIPDETTYLHSFNHSQLRAFLDHIDSKLRAASAMLHLMEPPTQLLPFSSFSPLHHSPLLQTPHPDLSLCFDDLDELCFEDLQSFFPEHDQIDHQRSDSIDHESLFLPDNDPFEFGSNLIMMPENHPFVYGNNPMTPPGNENPIMPDQFLYGNNLRMPTNCDFEFEFDSIL